jgi:hypothetical protein
MQKKKVYKNESSVMSYTVSPSLPPSLPPSLSLSLLLAQLPMGGINQQSEKTKTKNKMQTPKL